MKDDNWATLQPTPQRRAFWWVILLLGLFGTIALWTSIGSGEEPVQLKRLHAYFKALTAERWEEAYQAWDAKNRTYPTFERFQLAAERSRALFRVWIRDQWGMEYVSHRLAALRIDRSPNQDDLVFCRPVYHVVVRDGKELDLLVVEPIYFVWISPQGKIRHFTTYRVAVLQEPGPRQTRGRWLALDSSTFDTSLDTKLENGTPLFEQVESLHLLEHAEELIATLEQLTGWPLAKLPRPTMEVLSVQDFRRETGYGQDVWGAYDPMRNRLLISAACWNTEIVQDASAHCQGVLLHELVHWAQYRLPLPSVTFQAAREHQATFWKLKYLRQVLQLPEEDFFLPRIPRPEELPPSTYKVQAIGQPKPIRITDDGGEKQTIWLAQGVWDSPRGSGQWVGVQVFWHRGRLIGVEFYRPKNGIKQIVEAWWDQGYAEAKNFPPQPRYVGTWVKAVWSAEKGRWVIGER